MKTIIEVLKKNIKTVIGVGLVAIAGFSASTLSKKDIAPSPIQEAPIVEEPASLPVVKKATTKPASTPVVDNRAYGELIVAYKDSMLQFGSACQVVTSNQTYKVGEKMLLDNRNSVPVAIKLAGNTYTLGAYGYNVITLSSVGKFMVDCNDHQNVATVLVQK